MMATTLSHLLNQLRRSQRTQITQETIAITPTSMENASTLPNMHLQRQPVRQRNVVMEPTVLANTTKGPARIMAVLRSGLINKTNAQKRTKADNLATGVLLLAGLGCCRDFCDIAKIAFYAQSG
jgi:hypothetical protein